ncbi:hypothetical protein A6A06_13465 [Streptomyces sp. CB02923]|uniref:hypothetical protein n=1 Tax=Streptomyces sp. CB02923 TaxID=1718985 RepID=UPI00093E477B|nr:hypothetical protein [Streptomyces sp. CB02923]OKI02094.1 hypothetical protein A6A06_13465 [Streptomyces sp. CB02923]
MDPRKTVPGPRKALPDPRRAVPSPRTGAPSPREAVPDRPKSATSVAEGIRVLLLVAVLPAVVVTAVALSPPAATRLICAGLLGAGCTCVAFAVAGGRCLARRSDGRRR